METTTIKTTHESGSRRAAVNALAIVGFIVLVIIGMVLAVYAARFIPTALSNIGSAAVYLSSQVFPADEDGDLVVVDEGETVPFGDDASVATTTETAPTPTPTTPTTPDTTPRPGTPTTVVVPVQVPASTNYHGLPDLVVESMVTGYLSSGSDTDSFRSSNEVPDGKRGALKFTIVNRGTNISGRFEFEAELPTTRSYTYNSRTQQTLRPGERIEYVLGFDQAREGENRTITVTVDPDDDIDESNERNNERSVTIDIED